MVAAIYLKYTVLLGEKFILSIVEGSPGGTTL